MRAPTGIRFSDDEHEAISRYADANGMSFSDVVRHAARAFVNPDFGKGYLSLRDISMRKGDGDIDIAFGQFLDDFAHAKDKAALIEEEPMWQYESAGRWFYDFAATAHKLAHDNGLPVPEWCLQEGYYPPEPFYAFDTSNPEFQAYLRENTPREFVWHGLYLGPNVLQRA